MLESPRPKFTDAPRLDEDCLVLSDTEVPFHHAGWINDCVGLAREVFGIDVLWIAGDFVHNEAFSFFPGGDKNAEREIEQIGECLDPFLQFKRVMLVNGNHDDRLRKLIDRELSQEILDRIYIPPRVVDLWHQRVKRTDYFYGFCGEWRIAHPRATSVIPAAAAADMVRYLGMNVLMGHNHLTGLRQAGFDCHTGRTLYAVEIGCCVDTERLAYYMTRDSRRPKMSNGAAILRQQADGFYACTLLTRELFDWRLWRKLGKG